MKKRLPISLILTFCAMLVLNLPAFAWHFENVELSADCDGFTITGEVWLAAPGYHVLSFEYSLSFDNVETVSGIVDIGFDLGDWGGYPFEISGFWEEGLTGDVEVEGIIEWIGNDIIYDSVIFEPLILNGPCVADEGCSPGYWKNHEEDWVLFDPGDDFDLVFGTDLFYPDITLGEALRARGGGSNRLARHGTAALLSAAHPEVSYPLTVDEVIEAVEDGETDELEEANELGCPL